MSNFGDADKLAAAKELQRSFLTRADSRRGPGRATGPRRGAAANTFARPTAAIPRDGYQAGSYPSGNLGSGVALGHNSEPRLSARRSGVGRRASSTRDRTARRYGTSHGASNTRNLSHSHYSATDDLALGVPFGQLSTGSEGNGNYGTVEPTDAHHSNASTAINSWDLGVSRFADQNATSAASAAHPPLSRDVAHNDHSAKTGRFVGFYQDLDDELEFVPDDAPVRVKGGRKGLQTSRFANPETQFFHSSSEADPAMIQSTSSLDQANPRYEGFYQDADQQQPVPATQAIAPSTINHINNQHSNFGASNPTIPQGSAPTTFSASTTTQYTAEMNALQGPMDPVLRESLDLYLQLTAQADQGDAMDVDEVL